MERLTELQQETMGDGQAALNALPEGEDSVKVQSRYITRASLFPPHQNTQTWYYPTGEALYARMLTELEQAEHSIFLEYFIIHPGVMWDGILEILERKAAQGVDVPGCSMMTSAACSPCPSIMPRPCRRRALPARCSTPSGQLFLCG